jgi:hypothetical protein
MTMSPLVAPREAACSDKSDPERMLADVLSRSPEPRRGLACVGSCEPHPGGLMDDSR